jgi:hypothetical protein
MPKCGKCGKKGLFLKIEEDTGLCLSCNELFAQEGKVFTERITSAKNKVGSAKDPKDIAKLCQMVENYGNELLALHQSYNLHPSQELLDLIASYKKIRVSVEREFMTEA